MKKLQVIVTATALFITGCASQRPWYNTLVCSVAGGAVGAAIGGAAEGGREAGIGAGAGAVAGALLCAALTPKAAPDTDGDGVPDSADKCPNTPAGVKVDAAGCPLDSDGDGVPDYQDQCPGTPRGVKVNQLGCPERESIILKGVNFEFDSAELTKPSHAILDGVAKILAKHSDLKVRIAGHTDSKGTAAYNKNLSQRRAESVMNYLISRGVSRAHLAAVGFGEEQPIASNDSDEGRAENRRVELQPQE